MLSETTPVISGQFSTTRDTNRHQATPTDVPRHPKRLFEDVWPLKCRFMVSFGVWWCLLVSHVDWRFGEGVCGVSQRVSECCLWTCVSYWSIWGCSLTKFNSYFLFFWFAVNLWRKNFGPKQSIWNIWMQIKWEAKIRYPIRVTRLMERRMTNLIGRYVVHKADNTFVVVLLILSRLQSVIVIVKWMCNSVKMQRWSKLL